MLLYVILFLGGCSFLTDIQIDNRLHPYLVKYDRYATECKVPKTNGGLSIMFDNIPTDVWGYCRPGPNSVKLNIRTWHLLTEPQREQLVFHELAHCLLDQEHDDDDLNIMNTAGFIEDDLYSEYYDYFIRRLFINCKKPITDKFKYEGIK